MNLSGTRLNEGLYRVEKQFAQVCKGSRKRHRSAVFTHCPHPLTPHGNRVSAKSTVRFSPLASDDEKYRKILFAGAKCRKVNPPKILSAVQGQKRYAQLEAVPHHGRSTLFLWVICQHLRNASATFRKLVPFFQVQDTFRRLASRQPLPARCQPCLPARQNLDSCHNFHCRTIAAVVPYWVEGDSRCKRSIYFRRKSCDLS